MSPGRRAARALALVALVLLAFACGVAAAWVHRTRLAVADVGVPIGMLAALAALAGLLVAARAVGRSRVAVGAVAAAYALPVLVMSQFRPEGDLVVAQDAWGLTLLGGIALVVTVAMVVPFAAYHGDRQQPALDPSPPSEPVPALPAQTQPPSETTVP
jgi:hypothetical protein